MTNDLTGCYTVVYFNIEVYPIPMPNLEEIYVLCTDTNGSEVIGAPVMDTGLNMVDYSFEWSFNTQVIGGATDSSYMPAEPGQYSVTVTDNVTGCVGLGTAEVYLSTPPAITAEVTTDAFSDDQVVVVTADGPGDYEYSLDNGLWQDDNVFTDVSPGEHLIRVRDIYGCGETSTEVLVVGYPPYFTPNGDGYHDTWNVIGLEDQASAKIYIFDRYGKLLKQLSPTGIGWDGSYNGYPLPSNDYWFSIEYAEPNSGETVIIRG